MNLAKKKGFLTLFRGENNGVLLNSKITICDLRK
jgi:hypothetical protein